MNKCFTCDCTQNITIFFAFLHYKSHQLWIYEWRSRRKQYSTFSERLAFMVEYCRVGNTRRWHKNLYRCTNLIKGSTKSDSITWIFCAKLQFKGWWMRWKSTEMEEKLLKNIDVNMWLPLSNISELIVPYTSSFKHVLPEIHVIFFHISIIRFCFLQKTTRTWNCLKQSERRRLEIWKKGNKI